MVIEVRICSFDDVIRLFMINYWIIKVSEIKSYRLSDDGNMLTIMMKDGTVQNNLIFLDDGK